MIPMINCAKNVTPSNSERPSIPKGDASRQPTMVGIYYSCPDANEHDIVLQCYSGENATFHVSGNGYIWGEYEYIKETTSSTIRLVALGMV